MPDRLPRYTKEELATIIKGLKSITVKGLPVFDATIINGATNDPIGLDHIRGFGMIYIKIDMWGTTGNFPALVDVEPEGE